MTVNPAQNPAENPPTRKRGRPRKEKPPKPKRPRGRPPGLKPEVLDILFEFILSPEMRSGGRFSRKRALRTAAARVKIPVPASVKAPPFPDLLARAKPSFERKRPVAAFDTYEEAERTAIAARSAARTKSLTLKEQKKLVDSAGRFLKKTKALRMMPTRIPPGDYQLCAGCGEVLSGGDPCLIRSVLNPEVGIPVKVYVHPKREEHPDCISAWHKSDNSQTLDRLDLAAQLTPENGDEGDFYFAQIEVPGVCTTIRGGESENSKTRQKKLEKWVKGDVLKLFPEELKERENKLFSRRDEYGLDLTAQREANGGNTRMRASEGLSRIDGDAADDEDTSKTSDIPLPKSVRSVAIGKNHVEDAVIEKLYKEALGADAEEAAVISLKARQENHPVEFRETVLDRTSQSILARALQSILARISDGNPERIPMTMPRNTWEESATCNPSYIEDLVAKETDKELDKRYSKDFFRIKMDFQYGLIDRAEKDRRIKEARAAKKEAKESAEKEREELDRSGPRLESSDRGISSERFDANALLPTGLRPRRQEKIVGKGNFRTKFRGSYYERDAQDQEGETPLYQNHPPYARRDGFAHVWRGTFSTRLLDSGSKKLGWPCEIESLTDEQIEQRKRARAEWEEYRKKSIQRSSKADPKDWSPICREALYGAIQEKLRENPDDENLPTDPPAREAPQNPWPMDNGMVAYAEKWGFCRILTVYRKRKGMKLHFVGEKDRFYSFEEIGPFDLFKPTKKNRKTTADELAIVSQRIENAVGWWPWNPREASVYDDGIKRTLDQAAEYARAQWKHKQCKQYDPSMVYEIDGVTPVLGGQKSTPKKKFLARTAPFRYDENCGHREIVRMDGWFKRKFGGAYFLADLVNRAFRRERFFDSVEDSFTGLVRRVRRSISPDALADACRVRQPLPKPGRVLQSPSRSTTTYRRCSFEGKIWWESYYPYWGWTDRRLHAFGINEWNIGRVKLPLFIPQIPLGPLAKAIKNLPFDVRVLPIRHGPVCGTSAFRYAFPTEKPCRAAEVRSSWDTRCQWCPSPCVNGDADFPGIIFTLLNRGETEKVTPLAA
jgi:hypothetical protein